MFKWDNKGDNKWLQLWQAKAYRMASRVDQLATTIGRIIIDKKTTNLIKFLIFELDMKSKMVCFIEENNFSNVMLAFLSYWKPTKMHVQINERQFNGFFTFLLQLDGSQRVFRFKHCWLFIKPLDQFDVDIEPNLSIIKY